MRRQFVFKGPDTLVRLARNGPSILPNLPPRRKSLSTTVDTRRGLRGPDAAPDCHFYRSSLGPSADGPPGPDGPESSPPAAAERLLMAGEELLIPGVFVVPGPPGPSFVFSSSFGGPLLLCPPPAIRCHSPRMRHRLRRRPSPADPLRRGDGASLVGRFGVMARGLGWG